MRELASLGSLGGMCLRCRCRMLAATPPARPRPRRGVATSASAAVAEQEMIETVETGEQLNEEWPVATAPPPLPLPPQAPQLHPAASRRSSSLAMFQNIVDHQGRTPGAGPASIELVKDVARIQTMLEREGATLASAYAHFEDVIYPQLTQPGPTAAVPQIIRNQIATVLLDRLAQEKPQDFDSSALPSVTRITEVMIELDVLRPAPWATLVIELIQHVHRQSKVPDAYASIKDYETAMARRDAFLHDLLGAWKAFCAQRPTTPDSSSSPSVGSPNTREGMPRSSPPTSAATKANNGGNASTKTLQNAFGAMFPQYLAPSLMRPSFAAFATYKLLADPFNRSRATNEEAVPFLHMMKDLISGARPPRREDFKPIFDSFPDLPRFVWPARQAQQARAGTFIETAASLGGTSQRPNAAVHKKLGEALKRRNLAAANRAWLDFWGDAATPDAERVQALTKCPEMFNYFIMAYTTMRRPQLAIDAWTKMESIGIKPTIKTWTSMLEGCARANNASGVDLVWDRLLASGTKLDTAIWTARIHGLFVCGKPDAGIRALDEMDKTWARRHEPGFAAVAVRPTIEPVNAAIASLLRLKRDHDATQILSWASKHGIRPDIYTFNTLFRPLVARGDMKAIDDLFATMEGMDIRADIATFTSLLEGIFSQLDALSPAQQVALVNRVLAAAKASGVKINMQAYGKILHVLLRDGGAHADEAVKAILSHIRSRGLEPSSHILTMLAQYFFSRDPPDADFVTDLIEKRRLHDDTSIDRIFWERVVKGYCQVGDLRRAMDVFDRVFTTGTTIAFGTLFDLLRALVRAGDGAGAARVVHAAYNIGTLEGEPRPAPSGGKGKRYWRHRFWHLAHHQGLMGEQLTRQFVEANSEGEGM
ncbi:hypothetical protein C8A05DRAFT_18346 [Staphylotrichum tortipilum]|uniref:Pentatricopeptide repeat-containing protein n=1 Tax=Staphylotrichum tortipilum TaxID=2831512 RepID=A0AAN6MFJ9_9PEZI|nr:hypothetical protein C8A05DRAFT_18346 [Staphylotrichum longicolle]